MVQRIDCSHFGEALYQGLTNHFGSRARLEKAKSIHPNVNMTKCLFHTQAQVETFYSLSLTITYTHLLVCLAGEHANRALSTLFMNLSLGSVLGNLFFGKSLVQQIHCLKVSRANALQHHAAERT